MWLWQARWVAALAVPILRGSANTEKLSSRDVPRSFNISTKRKEKIQVFMFAFLVLVAFFVKRITNFFIVVKSRDLIFRLLSLLLDRLGKEWMMIMFT